MWCKTNNLLEDLYHVYLKKEVNISILIFEFLMPNVFELWRTLVADKTHFRHMVSTKMIYSSCLTYYLSF